MNEILRDNYHNMEWTQDIVYRGERQREREAESLERDGGTKDERSFTDIFPVSFLSLWRPAGKKK